MAESVRARAAAIRLVSFDVDGVLTDGRLLYTEQGDEIKAFHVQDGSAIKLLLEYDIEVALITGRRSAMVARRAAELGIRHVFQGVADKAEALAELCTALRLTPAEIAHVGDDLPDLPLFRQVGFAIGVPNGHPATHGHVHHVTTLPGGAGVAREVAELLLRARGNWPFDP
ncbi:MAG: HAD hydrolase family protein [Pseudomonadales bacterium]|nr:HAD hydrolase family protein [Pseudomonadales bacterium]